MARLSKTEARQFLAKVPSEKVFRCNDGYLMNDLPELVQALNSMNDEIYRFHANESKNDFSNWINDVIGDRELAGNIRKAKDHLQAAKVVSDRVSFLNKIVS